MLYSCTHGNSERQGVGNSFVPTYFRSQERKYHGWNFRSLVLSLPGTFAPESENDVEHSLPNAKSKTWSFRSPCFKCVYLSEVIRIVLSICLTAYYRHIHVLWRRRLTQFACRPTVKLAGAGPARGTRLTKRSRRSRCSCICPV